MVIDRLIGEGSLLVVASFGLDVIWEQQGGGYRASARRENRVPRGWVSRGGLEREHLDRMESVSRSCWRELHNGRFLLFATLRRRGVVRCVQTTYMYCHTNPWESKRRAGLDSSGDDAESTDKPQRIPKLVRLGTEAASCRLSSEPLKAGK
ncbi:hypothetical protein LZ32DRAFT_134416 [Colletotrichum eremochloae]|nr:hypothetical protein LZ32DRAFT_134416 [Colletotrichum eremochloae]